MATAEDSPLKLVPKKKRRLSQSLDRSKCIICQAPRGHEKLSTATSACVQTLVSAAKRRNDDVTARLIEICGDLDNPLDIPGIQYHRNCRASYTSAHTMSFADHSEGTSSSTTQNARSSRTSFDLNCCIICGHKSCKGDKTLHKIQTLEKQNILKETAQN